MSTPVDELAVLRQTNVELLAKLHDRTARITDLETQLASPQATTQTAQAELTRIQVTEPTQTLAAAISPTPELWASEMQRLGYSFAKQDGKLVIMQGDKKVDVEVTVDGLRKFLLSGDPAHKNMPHLIITNKASGSGAVGQSGSVGFQPAAKPDKPVQHKPHFGLGLRG